MAYNTIGVKLYLNTMTCSSATSSATATPADYGFAAVEDAGGQKVLQFTNLQEVGELGFYSKTASNGFDQIEVTTLADNKHVYIDGLIADANDNDNNELSFKFLYHPKMLETIKAIMAAELTGELKGHSFYVELPDGTKFGINARISNVVLDSISVGNAMTMGMTLSVNNIDIVNDFSYVQA